MGVKIPLQEIFTLFIYQYNMIIFAIICYYFSINILYGN
jgi:hypothetical protein